MHKLSGVVCGLALGVGKHVNDVALSVHTSETVTLSPHLPLVRPRQARHERALLRRELRPRLEGYIEEVEQAVSDQRGHGLDWAVYALLSVDLPGNDST